MSPDRRHSAALAACVLCAPLAARAGNDHQEAMAYLVAFGLVGFSVLAGAVDLVFLGLLLAGRPLGRAGGWLALVFGVAQLGYLPFLATEGREFVSGSSPFTLPLLAQVAMGVVLTFLGGRALKARPALRPIR